MKLTVVECNCLNANPHRKFETEDGRQSYGLFSLAEGRFILATLKDQGRMDEAEVAATDAQRTASGLPEFTPYDNSTLDDIATDVTMNVPPSARDEFMTGFAKKLGLSPTDANLLREKLQLAPIEVPA